MADNRNANTFQEIVSDYSENVRRIMELTGSENLKLQNAANALSLRVAQMGQQAAMRSITLSEQLTNKRMQDLAMMAQAYKSHYEAFGGVLNESALAFLDRHANIDAPTFTSIMAGYEHARASRAQNALAHINAQRTIANDQYTTLREHYDRASKAQEAMMAEEIQNLRNGLATINQQMENNKAMGNALIRADAAALNARQRQEAAALRAMGTRGSGKNALPSWDARRNFIPLTPQQQSQAQAQQVKSDYERKYGNPIESDVPIVSDREAMEVSFSNDDSGVSRVMFTKGFEVGDALRDIEATDENVAQRVRDSLEKFTQSDWGKERFPDEGERKKAGEWLVDYARASGNDQLLGQLIAGTYDFERSRELQEVGIIHNKNKRFPNPQLYAFEKMIAPGGINVNLDFSKVKDGNSNIFFDEPDVEKAVQRIADIDPNLAKFFIVRDRATMNDPLKERIREREEYFNLMRGTPQAGETTSGPLTLMDLISKGESQSYTITNTGKKGGYKALDIPNLTQMSINEVRNLQNTTTNAVGKYQIIPDTLNGAIKEMGLTGNEKFDELMQDRIFSHYLAGNKRRPVLEYIIGARPEADVTRPLQELALEWAALKSPLTRGGRENEGEYDQDGVNKATIDYWEAGDSLRAARDRFLQTQGEFADENEHYHYALTGKRYSDYMK